MKRLREWLIFKLIGDQPVIINAGFADLVFKKGTHVIHKPILINKNTNIQIY